MKKFQHVEDYLELISGRRDVKTGAKLYGIFTGTPIISLARYDANVLETMASSASDQKALTERQGALAIKIITKYKRQLAAKLIDVTPVEEDPKFRIPLRVLDYSRSLTIADDKLVVKFPFDPTVIEVIKQFKKDCQGSCGFEPELKAWVIGLTEYNLNWVHTIAKQYNFEISDDVNALVGQLHDMEKTDFKIELFFNGDKLDISNCPLSLRSYIENNLNGFDPTNLETLVDYAGELGYTIHPSIGDAMHAQYGPMFMKLASVKEAKIPHVDTAKFEEIIKYALSVNRAPIVVYEPNRMGPVSKMLYDVAERLPLHIQCIDQRTDDITIEPDAQIIHTTRTIRNMERIPMLISTGGMLYGSDKQIMHQRAGKSLFLAHEVWRGTAANPKPPVEKLDI